MLPLGILGVLRSSLGFGSCLGSLLSGGARARLFDDSCTFLVPSAGFKACNAVHHVQEVIVRHVSEQLLFHTEELFVGELVDELKFDSIAERGKGRSRYGSSREEKHSHDV